MRGRVRIPERYRAVGRPGREIISSWLPGDLRDGIRVRRKASEPLPVFGFVRPKTPLFRAQGQLQAVATKTTDRSIRGTAKNKELPAERRFPNLDEPVIADTQQLIAFGVKGNVFDGGRKNSG